DGRAPSSIMSHLPGAPMPEPDLPPPSDAEEARAGRSVSIFFQRTLTGGVRDTLAGRLEAETSADEDEPFPQVLARSALRYAPISELGRGGCATVYRVEDRLLERSVALKLLRLAGRGPEAIGRFREEAQATARLEHPNIVPVYDVGDLGGVPFYTMKYV